MSIPLPPPPPHAPPPGWYPAQGMTSTQRYWDGATWTAHLAPTQNQTGSGSVWSVGGLAVPVWAAVTVPTLLVGIVFVALLFVASEVAGDGLHEGCKRDASEFWAGGENESSGVHDPWLDYAEDCTENIERYSG